MVVGPLALVFKGIIKLLIYASKFWWVLFTILILFSPIVDSVKEGISEKDFRIPIKAIGTLIVSSDEGIYEIMKDAEFKEKKGKEFMDKLDYYLKLSWFLLSNLWRHLWMLIFWFLLFFKMERFIMGNDSKSLRAFVLAFLTMAGLQILAYGIPFKGLYNLIKFIIISI